MEYVPKMGVIFSGTLPQALEVAVFSCYTTDPVSTNRINEAVSDTLNILLSIQHFTITLSFVTPLQRCYHTQLTE